MKIIPPINFEFPKEKEAKFTTISSISSNQLTEMEIEQIRNQFIKINEDLNMVKSKIHLLKLLLIACFSLLICSILGLFYFKTYQNYNKKINPVIEKKITTKIEKVENMISPNTSKKVN